MKTSVLGSWLTLGRVSNLPTVWTNILAAALFASASSEQSVITTNINNLWLWTGTFAALSMMYLGGMFLNDAFDADWDKRNNNPRPIALGNISLSNVWLAAIVFMLAAIYLIDQLYLQGHALRSDIFQSNGFQSVGFLSDIAQHAGTEFISTGLMSALILVSVIVGYNWLHKRFPVTTLLMGMCRAGVYIIAALLLAEPEWELFLVASGMALYITGVTFLARQEHLNRLTSFWPVLLLFIPGLLSFFGHHSYWFLLVLILFYGWIVVQLKPFISSRKPDIRKLIGGLLAAIPVIDALVLASVDQWLASLFCILVFLLLPGLQRTISPT